MAVRNGDTQAELIETITHLAFSAGWPESVDAVMTAKEVFETSAQGLRQESALQGATFDPEHRPLRANEGQQ